jgi:hypothetical protein
MMGITSHLVMHPLLGRRATLPWDELLKLRMMLATQVLKLPLGGVFGYNIGSGGGYGGFGYGGFGGLAFPGMMQTGSGGNMIEG